MSGAGAAAAEAKPAVPAEYLDDPGRYFLEWIPSQLRAHDGAAGHFGRTRAVAQFHLLGERGGWWHFELGGGDVAVAAGEHPRPSFTLTMPVDVWRRMNRGEVSGLRAYLRGDVKVSGSRLTLLRVARLFG